MQTVQNLEVKCNSLYSSLQKAFKMNVAFWELQRELLPNIIVSVGF